MISTNPALSIWALFNSSVVQPIARLFASLHQSDRPTLYILLVAAVVLGFVVGRRRPARFRAGRAFGAWRFPTFQNSGEARVSQLLSSQFAHPNYHLMNHVTVQMDDGTTQIDHVVVSRFGVFVIETKDYNGWLFGNANDPYWTQVLFRRKFRFQNPLFQNRRHVRAVQGLLDFLSPEAVKSVVVFTGDAEFKTTTPPGVVTIGQLPDYLRLETEMVMSLDRLHLCVGRLETARLAISRETDVEHVRSVARRRRRIT